MFRVGALPADTNTYPSISASVYITLPSVSKRHDMPGDQIRTIQEGLIDGLMRFGISTVDVGKQPQPKSPTISLAGKVRHF